MLAPDAEADQPRRDAPQEWQAIEQPECERHLVDDRLADDQRGQDAVVHGFLHALHDARRKLAPALHLLEQGIHILAASERPRENVRRGDRVLDGEVDADASHRRHGVRRITDREQAGTPPSR